MALKVFNLFTLHNTTIFYNSSENQRIRSCKYSFFSFQFRFRFASQTFTNLRTQNNKGSSLPLPSPPLRRDPAYRKPTISKAHSTTKRRPMYTIRPNQ